MLVGAGFAGWYGLRPLLRTPQGSVLGVSSVSAFWQRQLLLTGDNGTSLAVWSEEQGIQPVAELRDTAVMAAAVAPDGDSAVLVIEREGSQLLAQYEAQRTPRTLAGIAGSIARLQFAPEGRFLSFLQTRDTRLPELDVLDRVNGAIRRVQTGVIASTWLPLRQGLVTLDAENQLWYHALQRDGSFDPPVLLGSARSNPVMEQTADRLFFIPREENQAVLASLNLTSREQHLIAPLPLTAPFPESIELTLSPSGKRMLLQYAAPQEPTRHVSLEVDLVTSAVRTLPLEGLRAVWLDEDRLFAEQTVAQQQQLIVYNLLDDKTNVVVTQGNPRFSP